MKLRVVWVGKTRNRGVAAACENMVGRIRRLFAFEITELKEPRISEDRRRIEVEGRKILDALGPEDYVVALDGGGQSWTSTRLAEFIGRHMAENPRDLAFVVGGPAGLSTAIRDRADLVWSLSDLTLSHDMARAVLTEQIYRALSIVKNLPYAR